MSTNQWAGGDQGTLVSSLRGLPGIVMAIALPVAIISLFCPAGITGQPTPLKEISTQSLFAFLCVFLVIVRFFHGNALYITNTYEASLTSGANKWHRIRLGIDFVVFLLQGILLVTISIYLLHPEDFYSLFIALFLLDTLWFVGAHSFAGLYPEQEALRSREEMRTALKWLGVNFFTAVIMLIAIVRNGEIKYSHDDFLLFVILANSVVDFTLNWRFYLSLPSKGKRKKIFISARFSSAFKDGTFHVPLKKLIDRAISVAEIRDIDVRNAHRAENFGKKGISPTRFVERDFVDVITSDALIAILDEDWSAGVWIEIGWASLYGIPLLVLSPKTIERHRLEIVKGLHSLKHVRIDVEWYVDEEEAAFLMEQFLSKTVE